MGQIIGRHLNSYLVTGQDLNIFAPQDCVGGTSVSLTDMEEWISQLKMAADSEKGMRFWVNNESFTPDFLPTEVSQFIAQIEITEKYAETHITFSWNHYYNPLNNSTATPYNDALKEYLKSRKQIE